MKIRITGSELSPMILPWYQDKIGQEFDVVEVRKDGCYIVKTGDDTTGIVSKDNCFVINPDFMPGHLPECGTQYRGCSPYCPKEQLEQGQEETSQSLSAQEARELTRSSFKDLAIKRFIQVIDARIKEATEKGEYVVDIFSVLKFSTSKNAVSFVKSYYNNLGYKIKEVDSQQDGPSVMPAQTLIDWSE